MGQKVNPTIFRMRNTLNWHSRWYADGARYRSNVNEDFRIRRFLANNLKNISLSKVIIERYTKVQRVIVYGTKTGGIVGKKSDEADVIRHHLKTMTQPSAELMIEEVPEAELDALLIAECIAKQLEKRVAFRKAIKRSVSNALKQGALGIKVMGSGRLNGAEIARKEWHKEGKIPLHTIEANIGYATATAMTTFGTIGVKVWVYKSTPHQVPNAST